MAKKKEEPKKTNKRTFMNRVLNFFNIAYKDDTVVPGKPKKDSEKNDYKPSALSFPSDIQKFYDYWISNMDTSDTLNNRIQRYKDLEFMAFNSGIMGRATQLYADETILPDEQDQILNITAKEKKVENYIKDFFKRIGITKSILEECAWDVSLYSDHFWVLSSDYNEGITEVTPIDVYEVEDRIEFNAIRASKQLYKNSYLSRLVNKDERMRQLYDLFKSAKDNKDYSLYFKNYLFGYSIANSKIVLPPWNVAHFRRFSTKSEYAPFGRPIFINSIAPFRMLKAGQNLVAMLRASKIPKEIFKVKTDSNMTEVDRWNKINEAREEFLNLTTLEAGQEDIGVGSQMWTDQEMIEYEVIENRTNIDDIADITMLSEDLITSTGIPPNYLIQGDRVFGNSGQSLIQQSKPFSRQIYRNQTAILDELINIAKLQFVMMGLFDGENTEFEISLNFPAIEESSDRLRLKSDSLRLAKDIIDNIGTAIGLDRGEALPQEIVKDIFLKYSFIDPANLDTWFETFEKSTNEEITEKLKEKISIVDEQLFREAYFNSKKRLCLYDGIQNKRHYKTSFQNEPEKKLIYECLKHNKESRRLIEKEEG